MFAGAAMKAPRAGFTLVELLVVIAIIGILVSLLLPAVQAARESGRQTQCKNNLKQIGLAVLNYEGSHKSFPPSGSVGPGNTFVPRSGRQFSWLIYILPQMEQTPLYQNINWNFDVFSQTSASFDVRIGSLSCPSDLSRTRYFQDPSLSAGKRFSKGNYAAFASPYRLEVQNDFPGMLISKVSGNAKVIDGMSGTALASEVRTLQAPSDQRGVWALPWNAASLLAFDMHPLAGGGVTGDPATIQFTAQTPNNYRRPNADVVYTCFAVESQARKMPCFDYTSAGYYSAAPRSGHPNGVYTVFGDGHVDFWTDSIDPFIMGYRIAINDGKTLSTE
jgi:prepilin-type N-terminal cleavage/methylation domain-containing protein